jgi:hypothetical protein
MFHLLCDLGSRLRSGPASFVLSRPRQICRSRVLIEAGDEIVPWTVKSGGCFTRHNDDSDVVCIVVVARWLQGYGERSVGDECLGEIGAEPVH